MITLKKLNQEFAICKLDPNVLIPDWVWTSSFYAITKTADELSIVCEQDKVVPHPNMQQENGWKCLQVVGQLDFSLTGILSSIAQPLAENKISIFAISTYNTDYILVKKEYFEKAQEVLKQNGFNIV
jgi:uncharacterized protein